MGREWVGLDEEIEEGLRIGSCEHLGHVGHVSLDLVQIELEIEYDMDTLV